MDDDAVFHILSERSVERCMSIWRNEMAVTFLSGVSPKSLNLTSLLNPKLETLCYPIQYSL